MKKIITLVLAAMMLVTCFVISVSAEDEKHELYVFRPFDNVEPNFFENEERDNQAGANGWCRYADTNGFFIYTYPMKNLANATKVTWTANIGQHIKLDISQDRSNWKNVYTCSDQAGDGKNVGDAYDTITYDLTPLLDKSGPKKLYVRLTDAFPTDGWGGAVTNDDDVILDIAYTGDPVADPHQIILSDAIWAFDKTEGDISTGGFKFEVKKSTPIDISAMKYVTFDLFISGRKDGDTLIDLEAMKAVSEFNLELTSSGSCDAKEHSTIFALADYVAKLVPGWNTVQIPFSSLSQSSATNDGGLDKTAWNYLRLFNISTLSIPAPTTNDKDETFTFEVKIANPRFEDATYDPQEEEVISGEHETYVFEVFTDSELEFLVETTAGKNERQRFSDAQGYTRYKYTIKNYHSVKKVIWTAKTNAQLLLKVSMDGQDWKEVYRYENENVANGTAVNAGLPEKLREYDLTEFLDFTKSNEIWISIEDSYPVVNGGGNGWGGSIFTGEITTLDVIYEVLDDETLNSYETAADEHSVSLWGSNEAWGGFQPDKENVQMGSACGSLTVGGGQVNEVTFAPVDGTGKDSLEFELYVSDLAFFDAAYADAHLEITSSGKADAEEKAWTLAMIKAGCVDGPKVGWNHVVLSLAGSENSGELNLAAVNYLRFFFVSAPEDVKDVVVKVDNFRLTDAEAVELAAATEEAQSAIAKMDALTYLTVDSITDDTTLKAAKKAYNSAKREYDKLSDLAKSVVPAETLKKLTDAEAAIEGYSSGTTPGGTDETGTTPGGTDETGTTPGGTDETQASGTGDKETEAPAKKGCGSVVVSGAVIVLASIGLAGFAMSKKKED